MNGKNMKSSKDLIAELQTIKNKLSRNDITLDEAHEILKGEHGQYTIEGMLMDLRSFAKHPPDMQEVVLARDILKRYEAIVASNRQ